MFEIYMGPFRDGPSAILKMTVSDFEFHPLGACHRDFIVRSAILHSEFILIGLGVLGRVSRK